jgi:hypothetical protein
MAATKVQGEIETWIVEHAFPKLYRQSFSKKRVRLCWGGFFEADAISNDNTIVACISTSSSIRMNGKPAIGKRQKIMADAFYLSFAEGFEKRLLVFTEKDMKDHFQKEGRNGRFPGPADIELRYIRLPPKLEHRLKKAKRTASNEMLSAQAKQHDRSTK